MMINPYLKKNGGSETNLSNMVAKDFQAFLLSTIVPSCPIAALRHSNVVDVCALSKLPLGGIGSKCAPKTREKEKECIYTMDHGYQNWPFSKCLPPNFHHFANIHLRSIPSLKYTNFIRSKPANHRSQVVTFRKK